MIQEFRVVLDQDSERFPVEASTHPRFYYIDTRVAVAQLPLYFPPEMLQLVFLV